MVKKTLMEVVHSHIDRRKEFVRNPDTDFTRTRKLSMEDMIMMVLSMRGGALAIEIEKYFNFSEGTPTKSAFVQQRQKLLPSLFESIFHEFSSRCNPSQLCKGYRLLAVDGSDLNVTLDENAPSYVRVGTDAYCNQLHLNALYDICNKLYVDLVVQPKQNMDEQGALKEMLETTSSDTKSIILADRAYEGYNTFAHLLNRENTDFVVRVKHGGTAMRNIKSLPMTTFDKYIDVTITDKQSKKAKESNWVFMQTGSKKGKKNSSKTTMQRWDFPFPYTMRLRVVRFMINDKPDKYGHIKENPENYETIVTSLSPEEFSLKEIKQLYHMRWGIETSFRELKYFSGLVNLHAKNEDSVLQEVYACFTMYNFSMHIAMDVVIEEKGSRAHKYQPNYSMAIQLCRSFFSKKLGSKLLLSKIQQHIEPIRPDRQDKRKMKPKAFVPFLYRVAA